MLPTFVFEIVVPDCHPQKVVVVNDSHLRNQRGFGEWLIRRFEPSSRDVLLFLGVNLGSALSADLASIGFYFDYRDDPEELIEDEFDRPGFIFIINSSPTGILLALKVASGLCYTGINEDIQAFLTGTAGTGTLTDTGRALNDLWSALQSSDFDEPSENILFQLEELLENFTQLAYATANGSRCLNRLYHFVQQKHPAASSG